MMHCQFCDVDRTLRQKAPRFRVNTVGRQWQLDWMCSSTVARPRRVLIPGATYHVMNRGNRKASIFEDDRDRRRFIAILIATLAEYGVELLGFSLMGNHFHLVVVTPAGNLSEFMQQLEGRFASYSNWRHQRVGHVFQGPFIGVLIESDIHLFIATLYVFMNPVVAGLATGPADWKWSSYAATAGLTSAPDYLSLSWLEVLFPAETIEDSQRRLRRLMDEARPIQAYLHEGDALAGTQSLKHAFRSYVGERYLEVSLPRLYRTAFRPSLPELLDDNSRLCHLADAIHRAHVAHGYTFAEIAVHLGIHRTTVSKIYQSGLARCATSGV